MNLTFDTTITKTQWPAADWVTRANSEAHEGFMDWRLPTVAELSSRADYSKYPVGDPAAIFMTSESTVLNAAYYFFGVDFDAGFVLPAMKRTIAYVRLVRGQLNAPLMWKELAGETPWRASFADGDWRLPTVAELLTLPDRSRNPATPTAFPNMQPDFYWTSTPAVRWDESDSFAWAVNFGDGSSQQCMKSDARPIMLCKVGVAVAPPVVVPPPVIPPIIPPTAPVPSQRLQPSGSLISKDYVRALLTELLAKI